MSTRVLARVMVHMMDIRRAGMNMLKLEIEVNHFLTSTNGTYRDKDVKTTKSKAETESCDKRRQF